MSHNPDSKFTFGGGFVNVLATIAIFVIVSVGYVGSISNLPVAI